MPDQSFDVWLKTHFDGDALSAARHSFDQTKSKVKETDSAAKDLGLTAENLKSQLTGLLAAGAVWQQFKEGFEQVAALEQAMNQLERAAKRNGDNFDVVRGKIVGMADALKKAAGIDDDAAIRGMVDLYNATGDVANSMDLVRLAADVAVSGILPFEQALAAVTGVAQGKTRALVQLKLATDEDTASTLTAKEALEKIQKAFGGAAAGAKGLKVEVNRLKEGYEDFRNAAVEGTTPVLSAWMKFAKSWVAVMATAADMIGEIVHGVFLAFMKTGDALGALLKGDFAGAKRAMMDAKRDTDDMFDALVQSAKQTADKLSAIWAGMQAGVGLGSNTPNPTGGGGGGGGGDNPAKEMVNEWQAELDRWHQMQGDLQTKLQNEALSAEKKFEQNKLAMKKWGAKEASRIEKDLDKEREGLMDAQTQRILDQVRLEKEAAQAKTEMAFRYADAAIGAATAVFGQSKEIAYAEAIINTARAITAASPNVWLMAFAAATGVAQLAKISSTEPGGGADATRGRGFDDSSNDTAARLGGRRWAIDMVNQWQQGVSAGWAAGMAGGGSSSTDNSRVYNIHFHGGGFYDPAIMRDQKKLKRSLDVIDRTVDSPRVVARGPRK